MIKFLFIIILSSYGFCANSEIIALGTPGNQTSFKKYLEKNPQLTSLKDFTINFKLKRNNSIILKKNTLAVKGLLLEDLTPSIFLFKELSTFHKNKSIFSDESSKLISSSFYRLANLDRKNAEFWIKKGIFYDLAYSPSDEIFNPNIIDLHKKLLKDNHPYFYVKSKEETVPKNSALFINGKLVLNSYNIHPSSSYQVSIYKNGFKSKSFEIKGDALARSKPFSLTKRNLGTCLKPNFKSSKKNTIDKIFFSSKCVVSRSNFINKRNNSFKPFSKINVSEASTPNDFKKPSFFKRRSTWYVIGGVIAASVTYSLIRQANKTPRITPVLHD